MREERDEPLTWDVAALLLMHWGDDAQRALDAATFFHGAPLSFIAGGRPAVTYEVASLHIYPSDLLVRDAVRLTAVPPWPWALEPYLPPVR
jgi:membrane peptidoglycan carboxypeptidase